MKISKKTGRIVTIVFTVAILLIALYIMIRGLGLADGYDFGAGAYYYADIPDFEKHVPQGDKPNPTSVPGWIYYALFLIWGVIMWLLWKAVDKLQDKR